MILRLGSGDAHRRGCGEKATLLDRGARAGLPVPSGVIVLDEGWRFALERGLVRIEGSGARRPISVPDPSLLVHLVGLPGFQAPLAVRAAFSGPERTGQVSRGRFVPGLFVDGRRPAALAAGLAGVWSAAFSQPRGLRRDLIVQDMVHARTAGVAVTEAAYEDDAIDVADAAEGQGERAVVPGLLPKLRRGERSTEADPTARRVQGLLRGVRRVFGEDWTVEWADDGDRCWIIQLRPATEPAPRNEVLTAASHRDILPDPPSRLMSSLIASSAPGCFGYYRLIDPTLPEGRPFVEVLRGRPVLNLSLLTEVMRRWGLPTRLVTDSIGGAADRDFGLQPRRLIAHSRVLGRLVIAQMRSVRSARLAAQQILERTSSAPIRLADTLEELRWLYTVLVPEMLSLTAATSVPLALLRRAGVLSELAGRWRFTGTEMLEALAGVRDEVVAESGRVDGRRGEELLERRAVRQALDSWLDRFGHRGVYENDISRPRYREQPDLVLRTLAAVPVPRTAPRRLSLRAILLRPVARQAERTLRARESLRSAAMVGFERLRRVLLRRARLLVEDGVLPSVESIFLLGVEEVVGLEDGFRPDAAFWRARQEETDTERAWALPDVFHRRDDPESFPSPSSDDEAPSRLQGIGLTSGEVEGRAWRPEEPGDDLPPGFAPAETVLIARAVDLGWLPAFARVGGVAVETGGDLSHGSVVLREMGLPAVTNLRGLTSAIRTGDRLVLRASEGVVERLEPRP